MKSVPPVMVWAALVRARSLPVSTDRAVTHEVLDAATKKRSQDMNLLSRFMPAIFAALVLLGCILPLSGALVGINVTPPSLLGTPGALAQAGSVMDLFGNVGRQQGEAHSTAADAAAIARLLYIVPALALLIVVLNLRGSVPKWLELFAGISWVLLSMGLPVLAAQQLVNSSPMLKTFQSLAPSAGAAPLTFNPGTGGWLILLASAAIILHAMNILRVPAGEVNRVMKGGAG
jgi:hypothetical protein